MKSAKGYGRWKGLDWKGHTLSWRIERAALFASGWLLINTYAHIINMFVCVCLNCCQLPLSKCVCVCVCVCVLFPVNYFCWLQLPLSYWHIHKHFATICCRCHCRFSSIYTVCFFLLLLPCSKLFCISCWFLAFGFLVSGSLGFCWCFFFLGFGFVFEQMQSILCGFVCQWGILYAQRK